MNDEKFKILDLYRVALCNTKDDYHKRLESETISADEKERLWNVSLILHFMIMSHEKNCALLKFLIDNHEEAVFSKVPARQSLIDLELYPYPYQFLVQVLSIFADDTFKSSLANLMRTYERLQAIFGIAHLLTIPTALLPGVVLAILMPLSPQVFIPLTIVLGFIGIILFVVSSSVKDKLNDKVHKLNIIKTDVYDTNEALAYSLNEAYKYERVNASSGNKELITLTKEHESQLVSSLREGFFKTGPIHNQSLYDQVQDKFNQLRSQS